MCKFRLHGRQFKPPALKEIALMAAVVLTAGATVSAVGAAAPPVQKSGQALPDTQIEVLERKLLQRTFPTDFEDKRLQRLECLVFGATQQGTLQERWKNLQRTVAQNAPGRSSPSKSLTASVTEVENQVLKKSNAALPIASRLSLLETKVFGQTSPAMPLPQRVERLRKTIGLADPFNGAQTAAQSFKALPNGGFSFHFYGDPHSLSQRQMDPQLSQILKDMDRQMRQMEHFGDGMLDDGMKEFDMPDSPNGFRYDFSLPNPQALKPFVQINPGKPGTGQKGQPGKPGSSGIIIRSAPTQPIPPYGAPDSI